MIGAALPTRREVLFALGVIVVLALTLYLPYAFDGGIYSDDYSWLQRARYAPLAFPDGLRELLHPGLRPFHAVGTLYQAQLFGSERPTVFIPSMTVAIFESFFFYLLLRLLRLGRLPSAAASLFLVSLPWVDATRLWMTMVHEEAAVTVLLAGLCVAILGIRAETRRGWWAGLLGSLTLYLIASLTYEGVVGPIAFAGLVYACAAPARPAWRRARVDLAFVALGLLLGAATLASRGATLELGDMVHRARVLGHAWLELGRFSVPGDDILWGPLGVALLAAAAVGAGRIIQRRGVERENLREALRVTCVAIALAAAGLAVLVSTTDKYTPVFEGTDNRYGVVTAPPTMLVYVGVAYLVAIGLAGLVGRQRLATPIAVTIMAATLTGFVVQERQNQSHWIAAAREQEQVLGVIEKALGGRPPPGSGILTIRHENFTRVHIPVFTTPYDLRGALQLRYDDPTLEAHPYQLPLFCAGSELEFTERGPIPFGTTALPYTATTFVIDIPTGTAERLSARGDCFRLSRGLDDPTDRFAPPFTRLTPTS